MLGFDSNASWRSGARAGTLTLLLAGVPAVAGALYGSPAAERREEGSRSASRAAVAPLVEELAVAQRALAAAGDDAERVRAGQQVAAAAVRLGEAEAAAGQHQAAGRSFALAAATRAAVYPLERTDLERRIAELDATIARRDNGATPSDELEVSSGKTLRALRAALLDALADLAAGAGDQTTVRKVVERRLAAAETAGDPLALASALEKLAAARSATGDFVGARGALERALALRAGSADGTSRWRTLLQLGQLAADAGELDQARRRFGEVLATLPAPAGSEELEQRLAAAWARLALADLEIARGDFRAAAAELTAVRALAADLAATEDELAITTSEAVQSALAIREAQLLEARGDLAGAAAAYRAAHRASTALLGATAPLVGGHVAMARVERQLGHFDGAEASLQLAVAEYGRRHDVAGMARALGHLSALRLDQRRAVEGRELAAAAVALARPAGDPVTLASLQRALARAEAELGVEGQAAAEVHLREAIATLERLGLLLRVAYARAELGAVLERQRRDDEALAEYEAAVGLVEQLAGTLASDSERERFHQADADRRLYTRLVTMLVRRGRPAEAIAYLRRARAKDVVDALAGLRPADARGTGEASFARLLAARAKTRAASARLESRLARNESESELLTLRQALAASEREQAVVLGGLREGDLALASLVAAGATTTTSAWPSLGDGELLLEYLVGESETLIFAQRRGQAPIVRRTPVGEAGLRRQVEAFRGALELADDADFFARARATAAGGDIGALWRDDGSDVFALQLRPLREAAVALHRALLAPVVDLLREARHLVVAPDRWLQLVPFAALAEERADGAIRFVGEGLGVSYFNGAGAVAPARERSRQRAAVVALGDPDGTLPGAADEARAVAATLGGSRAFIGAMATLGALQERSPETALVHLATHALLDGGDPKESHLLLAGEPSRLSVRDLIEGRAGLSLAGVRLVTLSACETHLGATDPAALYGSLSAAFAAAGAPAVVATLWPVDDEGTRLAMVAFYRALGRGAAPAAALAAAQHELRLDPRFGHPRYWAPFVLLGE